MILGWCAYGVRVPRSVPWAISAPPGIGSITASGNAVASHIRPYRRSEWIITMKLINKTGIE